MPTSLAMLLRSLLLSHITRVCSILLFSSVARPSFSLNALSPPLKLCCPFFHCAIRWRLLPKSFQEVFMISFRGIPFLKKFLITALILSFSKCVTLSFLKSACSLSYFKQATKHDHMLFILPMSFN